MSPFFLDTTLSQKWGGGICSNIRFVLTIRPHPKFNYRIALDTAKVHAYLRTRVYSFTFSTSTRIY